MPGNPPRWPAEWEPHRATWLAWPHQRRDWPGKFAPVPWVYAEIVRHLHKSEIVGLLVNGAKEERQARRCLTKAGVDLSRVEFRHIVTDRVWTRDSGPIVVKEFGGRNVALKWRFNGWAKYPNHLHDAEVPAQLAALEGWERVPVEHNGRPVVLEGGSIDGNGAGLLLTTEECLLSDVQQRNPGFTRSDYEALFARHLGVRKVIWLNRGIAGDDTHGHVDDLARFVAPRTVVTVVESDRADENYVPLQENLQRLRGATNVDGHSVEIVPLPMPAPLTFAGRRLPASYANFYIANDCVLMPTFNDPNDRAALGILAELFPTRQVIGIHAVDLVWGFGTLHCLTQQEPA
ncbi:MAG: agmatine/peptidylarginine deiminase [Gemmataceae bacterium]